MKLTYFQLEAHLGKKLAAAYIVSGEELLLKHDAIKWISKAGKLAGYTETVNVNLDADQIYTLLYSHSMLTEKKILKLDCRDHLPNKNISNILVEYVNHPNPDTILLIDIGKIDDKISKSAWYQALEKIAIVVTIWPIPREQLPQWLTQRVKKYKMDMQLDAANLLADYVEGNLIAAANMVEKIYLLQPQQKIDVAFIETILTDESHFTIFDLVENVINKNTNKSLHILKNLQQEGAEPTLILWGLTRELRMLAQCFQQLQQGLTFETIFQKHKIFSRRQIAVRRFLNHSSEKNCWDILSHASEIDKIIKGAAPGNVWNSLELLCLRIS